MRAITKNSMALMIAIAVSGCNGDMLEMQSGDGMVPVEVNNVLSVNADITESRAASPVTSNGAKMGVFRIGDTKYTAQDNVEYTYSSSTTKWTSTAPINVGVQATNLCAYYPYNSVTFTTGTTATLVASKYEDGKDVSYATSAANTVTNQNPEASFAMKHAYARIKLAIKRSDTNFHGNCNISTVNLRNNTNFFANRTLNIRTSSYGGSAEAGGWTYYLNSGNMAPGDTNNAYDVLVPPQTVSSGLKITLVVDGAERSATIPAASFSSNLSAGSQYSISLLLTDSEVIPNGNVTITDWVTDNTPIESESEPQIVKVTTINVPASEINLGGTGCSDSDKNNLAKLTWAGGNLRSSDNTHPYRWATNQNEYGYYYTVMSTYTGNTSSNWTDPCTKLDASIYGSGWHTPSKNEFEMLVRCSDRAITNEGVWFMNKTSGLYLRLAGYCEAGSSTSPTERRDGTNGIYRTSSYTVNGGGYYSLTIRDRGNNKSVEVAGNLDNTLGGSVRCVRE